MKLASPQLTAGGYEFTVCDVNTLPIESNGAMPVLTILDISGYLYELCEAMRPFYSTPLTPKSFHNKMIHHWADHTYQPIHEFRIWWQLETIRVLPTRFEFFWTLINAERINAHVIPPGFLQLDAEELPAAVATAAPTNQRTVIVHSTENPPAEQSTLPGLELLEASEEAIPFVGAESAEETVAAGEKLLEKRRVREARLRVALARLKAERLAKRFFEKYGDMNLETGDQTESELSESEEEFDAYPKNIGSH